MTRRYRCGAANVTACCRPQCQPLQPLQPTGFCCMGARSSSFTCAGSRFFSKAPARAPSKKACNGAGLLGWMSTLNAPSRAGCSQCAQRGPVLRPGEHPRPIQHLGGPHAAHHQTAGADAASRPTATHSPCVRYTQSMTCRRWPTLALNARALKARAPQRCSSCQAAGFPPALWR